jgi:hypothetical protein
MRKIKKYKGIREKGEVKSEGHKVKRSGQILLKDNRKTNGNKCTVPK